MPIPFDRRDMVRRLAEEPFDLLVIGGGITGAGVALDAASRGLRTALVERDDFASGTSSKSSKLIHGGLRYLQQGEVRMVYEALAERQRLRKIAPHLVRIMPFLIPILTRDGVVNRKLARAMGSAMWMYDLTGGIRIGKFHRRLRKEQAFAHLPTMDTSRLTSAYLYYDAQADDARLCLTVARTAAAHGAAVANRCAVVSLIKDATGTASGATVEADGQRFDVRAAVVVNAAGVWSDEVRTLDEGHDPDSIRPAKGIHVTVPWSKVRNDIGAVIPVPGDKRTVFLVPWGARPDGTYDFTYVGTTDTDYDGPIDDPQCTRDDIDYVLRALNATVTTGITDADVLATWAGLRPLVKSASSGRTADLSRHHKVVRSASGVITVTGGKLTTYRKMAADTVDTAMTALGRTGKSRTKSLVLRGGVGFVPPAVGSPDARLAGRYGTEADDVRAIIDADALLGEPLVPGLAYVRAEAIYAARHEMATTLDDVLSRRTRARLLARDNSAAAAHDVARLLASELGWDDAEIERQVDCYRTAIAHERESGHLPETLFPSVTDG